MGLAEPFDGITWPKPAPSRHHKTCGHLRSFLISVFHVRFVISFILFSYVYFIVTVKSDTIMASDWSSLLRTTSCGHACMVRYQRMYIGVITGDLLISYTVIHGSYHFMSFFLLRAGSKSAIYFTVGSISMAETGATLPI